MVDLELQWLLQCLYCRRRIPRQCPSGPASLRDDCLSAKTFKRQVETALTEGVKNGSTERGWSCGVVQTDSIFLRPRTKLEKMASHPSDL